MLRSSAQMAKALQVFYSCDSHFFRRNRYSAQRRVVICFGLERAERQLCSLAPAAASGSPGQKLERRCGLITRAGQASQSDAVARALTHGRHCLECGGELELLSCHANERGSDYKPPLLFLHGAMHGAWCYAENFLPFFAERGHSAYALSLRGHGESDLVEGRAGRFVEHMDDIVSVIRSLDGPPVIVAHSLGGLLAQRYLSDALQKEGLPSIAGVAFIAAPALSATLTPSLQWFRELQGFVHGLKIIWWMNAMPKGRKALVKELFFAGNLPAETFDRFHTQIMHQRTILPVTGRELTDYKAEQDRVTDELRSQKVPVLVLAAGADRLLMPCQVEALGEMLGCATASVPGVGHDLMLDTEWRSAAEMLDKWIRSLSHAQTGGVREGNVIPEAPQRTE